MNTDADREEYARQLEELGVTWTSAWQGGTDGPLPRKWGVHSYPTLYVLDVDGRIRFVNPRGEKIGHAVDRLLAEAKERAGQ